MSEPFHPSPSFVPVIEKGFENDIDLLSSGSKNRLQGSFLEYSPFKSTSNERDKIGSNGGSLARIKVVVCFYDFYYWFQNEF